MHRSYLLLGSNLGDPINHLREAVRALGEHGDVRRKSCVYRSAAWGITAQPDFLNMTVEFHCGYSPSDLLDAILGIEAAMGRQRTEKWGPRLIDIDILFYDNVVVKTPSLVIPHPEIQRRRFTLVPLAEIAPQLMHPVLESTIQELLQTCSDALAVEKEGALI